MARLSIEAKIDKLPAGIHRIERGLYVRKREGRCPSWLFVYTVAGKRRELSLGRVGEVGITAAREKLERARQLVAEGVDPVEHRRTVRAQLAEKPEVYTFAKLFEEALPAIAKAKRWRNPKSGLQWRTSIETYALPAIGDKALEDITRDDVLAVLTPIWETKTETASRVRMRLEALFAYGIATGKMKTGNPAVWRGNLSYFLAPPSKIKKVEHFEALTVQEIRDALEQTDWNDPPVTWVAIAFGALTGARTNEFCEARWEEIKGDVWYCPRRKDGKGYPHRVPLSRQALLLLERLPHDSEWLFPSPVKDGTHINKYTPRVVVRKRVGRGTMHGFRSSFSDWAAEQDISERLSEKAIQHQTGNAVTRAYQRSDLLEQRRPIMQRWADTILPLAWIEKEPNPAKG